MIKKLLILLFCGIFLCGCTLKPVREEVSFSSWGSITEVEILKKIIADFETENPNVKIKFMHTPQNYFQKLHLLFASKTAPDVVFINNLYLPVYASQLCDLSDYVDKKEFYPQALEGLSYEGKLLAVPRDISNLVLYINTDMVSSPDKNWTLKDLANKAEKISKNGVWGVSFEEDIYWILPYLSYYGEVFGENFDSQESKGLRFYLDLRDKYKVAPSKSQVGSSTLAQMFLDKKLAMYLSGRWMYPKISEKADFNWAVASFPKGAVALPCDTSGWAVSKDSKHKNAAIEFVKYLSGEKSSLYFTGSGLVVPARVKTSKKLDNKLHNERVFLEVIKTSKNTPVSKNYKKLADKFNSTL